MADPWTIEKIIEWTVPYLASKGISSARLDAELLLAHALHCTRVKLYLDWHKPLASEELAAIKQLVLRRSRREPVAYLVGEREFYGRPFMVTPATLTPRPETEILVEMLLKKLPSLPAASQGQLILDVGTGSGNIAVTVACEDLHATLVASDISQAALAVAAQNAARLGVADRVKLALGNLFAALGNGFPDQCFTAIISNPPYIPCALIPTLMPEVSTYEPRLALDGGEDGLNLLRMIIRQAPRWLMPGGFLLLECDELQPPKLTVDLAAVGFTDVGIGEDYARKPRMVYGTLNR